MTLPAPPNVPGTLIARDPYAPETYWVTLLDLDADTVTLSLMKRVGDTEILIDSTVESIEKGLEPSRRCTVIHDTVRKMADTIDTHVKLARDLQFALGVDVRLVPTMNVRNV